ncbi:MAG: hypothetical protein U5K27_17395 [Desulfotignum sp.]|nr:hypothetical protein [Desulfotignum sp.]
MEPLLEVDQVRVRFRTKGPIKALLEKDDDPFIDGVMGVSLTIYPGQTYRPGG